MLAPRKMPSARRYINAQIEDSLSNASQKHRENLYARPMPDLSWYIPLGSIKCPPCPGLAKSELPKIHIIEQGDDPFLLWDDGLSESLAPNTQFNDLELRRSLFELRQVLWVRMFCYQSDPSCSVIRLYVLPEDVCKAKWAKDWPNAILHLKHVIRCLDVSLQAWQGLPDVSSEQPSHNGYNLTSHDNDSLFYIFNTLPSPQPLTEPLSCNYSNAAVDLLFDDEHVPGLKTKLYPYQRRAIATMVRREIDPRKSIDPRLQTLIGPTGVEFYFDVHDYTLLGDKRLYDEVRGGILAESMGLGKTLICLALILLTKGHWPVVPAQFSVGRHPIRERTGSLLQMAATAASESRVPWRPYFQAQAREGMDFERCGTALEEARPSYIISQDKPRTSRARTTEDYYRTIKLCNATLIIVPRNLLDQWQQEIATHLHGESLNVIALDIFDTRLPKEEDLLLCDIILMSRQRFQQEMTPTETSQHFFPPSYESALKSMHFLRVIMDEGHELSSHGGKNNLWWSLSKLHVDRKWVVTGTPASGLVGVEVDTATSETSENPASDIPDEHIKAAHTAKLERRRNDLALLQERVDLAKLGGIVTGFLKVQPWANSRGEDHASWSTYIMPDGDGERKPGSLRLLMESLVVRHTNDDIETDLQLPPLHNKVVYLRPSWHDKLSINLFVFTLIVNAVTSERVDEDYMYHPRNRHALTHLITNLRMSGFYWTSFVVEGVQKTLTIAKTYLEEHSESCPANDKALLEHAIWIAEKTLNTSSWKSLGLVHEMGMFVVGCPLEARQPWSLVERLIPAEPLLIGATQLGTAQEWIKNHVNDEDLLSRFTKLGVTTMQKTWNKAQKAQEKKVSEVNTPSPAKKRKSSDEKDENDEPKVLHKHTMSSARAGASPRKPRKTSAKDTLRENEQSELPTEAARQPITTVREDKDSLNSKEPPTLPADSPLAAASLVGTASKKLSYLLDRVLALQGEEKILIFYEGDHIAFYLAQAFDLVAVEYLIYDASLSQELKSAYVYTFNTTEKFRVMLMNVRQAAHGLHIAGASRVFFVNPVWQPNVEAQAIKRAHRIGQKKPVYVETLVLQDTIEDRMLQRRKAMTAQEHHKAEKSLLDDERMSDIIKDANFLPLHDDEMSDVNAQMAQLEKPQRVFGRSGRPKSDVADAHADLVFPSRTQGYFGKA